MAIPRRQSVEFLKLDDISNRSGVIAVTDKQKSDRQTHGCY